MVNNWWDIVQSHPLKMYSKKTKEQKQNCPANILTWLWRTQMLTQGTGQAW
uniref:Uncharacterized protein n=1 Tax=Arundo donax TaxID=35708 RepID=A0A0A8YP26_ARUDO